MKIKNLKINTLIILAFCLLICCSGDDDNETSKKQIISFELLTSDNATLKENATTVINENNKTISVKVTFGADISAITPVITVSDGASISPQGIQDFTTPVNYTVTAIDGTTVEYTVSVEWKEIKLSDYEVDSVQYQIFYNESGDIESFDVPNSSDASVINIPIVRENGQIRYLGNTEFIYNVASQIETIIDPDTDGGTTCNLTYDGSDNLIEFNSTYTGNDYPSVYEISYDANNNPVEIITSIKKDIVTLTDPNEYEYFRYENTFDTNNNLTQIDIYFSEDNLDFDLNISIHVSYDNKLNPWKFFITDPIKAENFFVLGNSHMNTFLDIPFNTAEELYPAYISKNNVTSMEIFLEGVALYQTNYVYTYNENDFPITQNKTQGSNTSLTTFNYQY